MNLFDHDIKLFKPAKVVTVRKKHQCVRCGGNIKIKETAKNVIICYDQKLISTYFCTKCYTV